MVTLTVHSFSVHLIRQKILMDSIQPTFTLVDSSITSKIDLMTTKKSRSLHFSLTPHLIGLCNALRHNVTSKFIDKPLPADFVNFSKISLTNCIIQDIMESTTMDHTL